MIIDGKLLADTIQTSLASHVSLLKQETIQPTLAVILVGNDTASLSYIKQKQKAAASIGADLRLIQLPKNTTVDQLSAAIKSGNDDQQIHGLIVQRPLPDQLKQNLALLNTISPHKDVDGFVPNSPFTVPVAAAVFTILAYIFHETEAKKRVGESTPNNSQFTISNIKYTKEIISWLQSKKICVIGRGSTAGKPIADMFISGKFPFIDDRFAMTPASQQRTVDDRFAMTPASQQRTVDDRFAMTPTSQQRSDDDRFAMTPASQQRFNNCATSIIFSQTSQPDTIIRNSDIVVSCVGKEKIVHLGNCKPGSIQISVGLWRDNTGKLRGDYNEEEIKDCAAWYTPTPGGVGPVNVACLMQNLITAAGSAR